MENISITLRVNARGVSFTRVMTSLVTDGRICLITWGRIILKRSGPGCSREAGGRLVLSLGHGLDSAAVNLREIGGVVDHKADQRGPQAVPAAEL